MGEQKLKNLYQVITLQRAIHKLKIMEPYKVCALTKIRNQTNGHVSERKSYLLNLVLINIYGPLPKALSGARYFLKIINNHTRKV
jgi:thiamine pyrophosphokinase